MDSRASPSPDQTVALLAAARNGDARAADDLFAHLYDELRRLSGAQLAAEAAGATLSATGLLRKRRPPTATPDVKPPSIHLLFTQPHLFSPSDPAPTPVPHGPAVRPQATAVHPQGETPHPHAPTARPLGETAQPPGRIAQPKRQAAFPHVPKAHPHALTAHPHGEAVQPQGKTAYPLGEIALPQGKRTSDFVTIVHPHPAPANAPDRVNVCPAPILPAPMPTLPLPELLARARIFFANLRADDETGAILADFGYDDAAVTDALALVETVQAAETTQKLEYAEQYAATRALAEAVEALRVPYVRHVRLARVVFDRGTFGHDLLGLSGDRADAPAALAAQARTFYAGAANEAVAEALARVRITAETVAEQAARIAAVEAALATQRREMGEAQQATRARDAEEARLRAVLSDASEVAKIALADRPQMRERLGLLER